MSCELPNPHSDKKLLHGCDPNELEDLEHHLYKAARLSRALWEIVSKDEINTGDKRTLYALAELASDVAMHASAAQFVFHRDEQESAGAINIR